MDNLNIYKLKNDSDHGTIPKDNSLTSKGTFVYFRDIENKLLYHISKAEAVFGAIAWLTNYTILDALSKLSDVSIIVQKEDFLRPDIRTSSNFKNILREKYSKLKCDLARYSFDNVLSSMSFACDPTIEPVRCVGNHNSDKKPAFPRMHNKFLVFATVKEEKEERKSLIEPSLIKPYAVWTGSFNFTKNATNSLENALYITDTTIVNAFFKEYGQIAAISESLDWSSDWMEPEWRIGT